MEKTILTYLSQIISQEEVLSKEKQDSQDNILHPIKRANLWADALYLDQVIFANECKMALFDMGLENSPW